MNIIVNFVSINKEKGFDLLVFVLPSLNLI